MGGAQALLLSLLRELRTSGRAQSLVLSMTSRWADTDLVAAIRHSGARLEFVDRGIDDPRLGLAVARLVHRWGGEVVHSHLSVANVGSRIGARIAGRPHLTTVHTMPGPLMEDSRARALADGWSARLSALLVAPSVEVADAYSAEFKLPRGRFRVVPNAPAAVDPGPFDRDALRAEIAPGAAKVVLCVARLQREKGIDDLVEAALRLGDRTPEARVLVAGDGPERETLKAAIARGGAEERIALLGHRSDIARLTFARVKVHSQTRRSIHFDYSAMPVSNRLGNVFRDQVYAADVQTDNSRRPFANSRCVRVDSIRYVRGGAAL